MARHTVGVGLFLTPADVAQILVIPLSTVLDLIESGELPAIKIGVTGRVRVERTALDSYIDDLYERRRREMAWDAAQHSILAEIGGGEILVDPMGGRRLRSEADRDDLR